MNRTYIDIIPAIIKGSRPSMYEGESFTALEYVSKIAAKTNECITEYNKFIDTIIEEVTKFEEGELLTRDLFERKIEQMMYDFKKVIELKYKAQDLVISNAVDYLQSNLVNTVEQALSNMFDNGELSDEVLQAVGNLKTDFNNTMAAINATVETMRTDIGELIDNANNAIETVHDEWATEKAEIETATTEAELATQDARDAIAALNLAILDMNGGVPTTANGEDDFDGGEPL